MIAFLQAHWVEIVAALVAIETAATYIVKLTPSTKDDELVQKVTDVLASLGVKPK